MPKRKHDYDYFKKKLKKLERKIKRRRNESSSGASTSDDVPSPHNQKEGVILAETDDEPLPGCSYWTEEQNSSIPGHDEVPQTVLGEPLLPSPLVDKESNAELPPELVDILGEDPTTTTEYGKNIQNDLAVRLCHVTTTGLSKDSRKELKGKYLVPENCKLIKAPTLNPEIHAARSEFQIKRDKAIENKQVLTSCAISSLSEAITLMLSSNQKDPETLKILMDTARILSDIQHYDSINRRYFILASLKKDLKNQLEKTKIDETLFGINLAETLKSAKNINKSGAELRNIMAIKPAPQKTIQRPSTRSLNLRAPPNNRRPYMSGGARGARALTQNYRKTSMPTAQTGSFKTSSRQQPPRHRR